MEGTVLTELYEYSIQKLE